MFLKSIKLHNFRNYKSLNFIFSTPITVLIGDNAHGKTNFLESIYFLATAKSEKADREEELFLSGEEVLRVEAKISKSNENTDLEIVMQKNGIGLNKKIKVNGIARRLADYSQNLAVVFFRPEDISLVTGSPSVRRYFVDQAISQIDKEYKRTVISYESILTRKNKILKKIREGFGKIDELDYWLDQQILLGNLILEKRKLFFDFLNTVEKKFGNFSYQYLPSEISLKRLIEYREKEIITASSLVGPHRDDFVFLSSGRDLSKFGSRGEQRTSVLDLMVSLVEFIENILGIRPVLLLDDIFSELDEIHRAHVVALSRLQQTVISTVEFDDYLEKELKGANFLDVKNGRITGKAGK